MSTGYTTGRSGISPVTLVFFVVVTMVGIAVLFYFYTEKEKVEWELADTRDLVKQKEEALGLKLQERRDILNYLDPSRKGPKEVADYFASLDLQGVTVVSPVNFVTVNDALQRENLRYQRFISELQSDTRVAGKRADIAEAEAANWRDFFEKRKLAKTTRLAEVERDRQTKLREIEQRISRFVADKKEFDDKHTDTRNDWQKLKSDMLAQTEQLRQQNKTTRIELAVLRPEPSLPVPVGKVLKADWEALQGVVNVGERDGVFPGLALEAFMFGRDGRRLVKAKFEVFRVDQDTSVVTITELNREHPVIAGDPVSAPFIPAADRRFVIAGFIPRSAEYNEKQLAGLIRLNGGQVQ